MMKIIILFFFGICNLFNAHYLSLSLNSKQVKFITICYVNKDIETFYNVTCDNFEANFGNQLLKKTIKDKKILKEFENCLTNNKNGSFKNGIDVRVKIYILYSNKMSSIICLDKFGNILIDNNYKGINAKLINFLQKNCSGFY